MKHLFLFLFLLVSIESVSQAGYYYNGHFVELIPEVDASNVLSKYSLNKNEGYESIVYHTKSGSKVNVLPQIILELNDSAYINNLIAKYQGILYVNKTVGDVCYLKCRVTNSNEVLSLVKEISLDRNVLWCEPDMVLEITSCNNNPYFPQQYYLYNTGQFGGVKGTDINVLPAWNLTSGNSSIKVAVIDSGVDLSHEDLVENLERGYTIDNPTGYGAPQNWNSSDTKAHGTACAGIIGSVNNDLGVVGVANGVKIVPVNIQPLYSKEDNPYGSSSTSKVAEAIIWAYNHADVLSCSWTYKEPVNVVMKAFKDALVKGRNGNGCVVVAAVGNDSLNNIKYPAALEGIIAVGGIDMSGERCEYSNRGKEISVVAPANFIYTTDIMGSLGYSSSNYFPYFSGTSAACPQVSGVAALMLSANPNLTCFKVKELMQISARDLGEKGWDESYGYGLVDAYKSVMYALSEQSMGISGPNVIENSGTYTVSNLIPGCSVKWSQSPAEGALNSQYASLTYDVSNPNSVIVNNVGKGGFSIKLGATIEFPSDLNIPAKRLTPIYVTGDCDLSGIYYEEMSDGSVSSEWPLVNSSYEDCNSATPGSIVHITSDNFRNRTVSYRYSNEYYGMSERYLQVVNNTISFEMPNVDNDKSLIFTVSGGGISSIHNFVFKSEGLQSYSLVTEKNGNNLIVRINDNSLPKINNETQSYEVLVYNMLTQKLEGRRKGNGESVFTTLPPGFYIIKLCIGGKILTRLIKF